MKKFLLALNDANQLMKTISDRWHLHGTRCVAMPPDCMSYVTMQVKKKLEMDGLSPEGTSTFVGKELFEFFKSRKDIFSVSLEDGIRMGMPGKNFIRRHNQVTSDMILGTERRLNEIRRSNPLAEHELSDDFYAEIGRGEFCDLIITADGVAMNDYAIKKKHWKARVAQKFILKPGKEGSYKMALFSCGNNKLLLDLEHTSKTYNSRQSVVLIDF